MAFNFSDKYKYMARRKGRKLQDIAQDLGMTRQNLSKRLGRDTWTQQEAQRLCDLIGCAYDPRITDNETGETI